MAAEGRPLQRRRNLSMIAMDLKAIWEMSDNTGAFRWLECRAKRRGMEMRNFTLSICLLLLASCVGTNQYSTDLALGVSLDSYATLHITRPNIMLGSAISAPVSVNGVLVGQIGPGGYIKTKIPTGKVIITSTTNNVTLDVQGGNEYYVEVNMQLRMWINTPDIEVRLLKVISKNQ